MDKLFPDEVIRNMYKYDSTYKHIVEQVLLQLTMHCFMYRCSEGYKQYNQCFCYCQTCRTYLRLCRQIFYEAGDMTEDDLEDIVPMTNYVLVKSSIVLYNGRIETRRNNFTIVKGN